MDFSLSEDQLALQSHARRFAEREIAPAAAHYDETEEYPRAVIDKAFDAGLMYMNAPDSLGGAGLSLLDECLVTEELASGCAGITLAITISNIVVQAILMGGSEAQAREFIGGAMERRATLAYALTEPGAGSDAKALRTHARKVGDEYSLSGAKCFITGGNVAERFVVFATTDPSLGYRGIAAFCIPADREGVRVGPSEKKMGQHAAPAVTLGFEDVRVHASERLGAEGTGFKLAMEVFNRTRATIASLAVGIAQRALEHAARYACERQSMGARLIDHQGIGFKLADMDIRIAAARRLIHEAAWLADTGRDSRVAVARAKTLAGDTAMFVTTEAVQVFGGYGYMREYPVEKLMRDAKVTQIYEGSGEVQRLIVAKALGAG